MKRVCQHPPEPLNGKHYWRGRQWLEREFPSDAAELNGDEWSRRDFLKLMGASMALAGVGLTSCRRPEMHLVPFTKSVEWTIPGKFLYYATAMPRRTGAISLIATTVDGRPIKLEGNPLHPASGGATDTFVQASILDLYDPSRSRRFVHKGKASNRADFDAYIGKLRDALTSQQGDGLAFLVGETLSPTRERLRSELEKKFPSMRWCVYEPLLSLEQMNFIQAEWGRGSEGGARLVPKLDRADVILALDSDFLDCGQGDLESVRAFTARRRVKSPADNMNRLYVVENHFTLTGAMADHRLRCPASQIAAFAQAIAKKILAGTNDPSLSDLIGDLQTGGGAKFDEKWITEAANDLLAKPGASLVLVGTDQPLPVQMLGYVINDALKNVGQTLVVRQAPQSWRTISISKLAADINDGRIKQLFILGGDPVYNAARGLVQDRQTNLPLDWADLQNKVPEIVRLGYHEDATSALSHWHVPLSHYLESWGDALTADGDYLSIQPMILPLFDGLSEIELLNALLGGPKPEGPELVQKTFRGTNPAGDFQTAWSRFLHDGSASHVQPHDQPSRFGAHAASPNQSLWTLPAAPTPDSPEIVLTASYAMDDGRYANNGWLQELPDPITKLTWDNAALMSPSFAHALGVRTGDLVQITITEKGAAAQPIKRELVIAALVSPGHADNSITISLGYGRKMPEFYELPYAGGALKERPGIAQQSGFNGYFLRTAANPHFAVAGWQGIESVRVTKVGRTYPLSITQEHFSIEGRGLVREATLERYREDSDFAKKVPGEEELPHPPPSIYSHPPLDAPQQWGMNIDLNVCTGCSACVIACQAENNIPVVGKLQVAHGRAMHWIRIDRYYASRKPYNQDRGDWPENPEVVHQPMPCQHCENAPCETVCPVNATVHSEDGLNVMAYTRCVGTRYCANNCPFKVRRFNFFDYNQRPVGKRKIVGALSIYEEYFAPLTTKGAPDIIKMQKNPNVTVRMRGVMEKCTFCVQRIEEAKIGAIALAGASADKRIPRDSFTTACAQACPTGAIVFGDIKDAESRVSKMKQQDRNYRLLDYLNIGARTSYLARIRNPNPKMPDAENIGVASLVEKLPE